MLTTACQRLDYPLSKLISVYIGIEQPVATPNIAYSKLYAATIVGTSYYNQSNNNTILSNSEYLLGW